MTSAPESANAAAPILVLCRDLMFASKIRSAAGSIAIKLLRDPAQLIEFDGTALIVDLSQDGAVVAGVTWKSAHPAAALIGFVGHTDAATIARATAAGFDRVLTRGQFAANLPAILEKLAAAPRLESGAD